MTARRPALALVLAALAVGGGAVAQPAGDPQLARIAALESRLDSLATEIQLLEDSKAIKRLQRAYGYYVDKKLAGEIAPLFAEDATVELGGMGVYVGRQRIGEFYQHLMQGPIKDGELYNHMILQGVVHVAPNGKTARGRWRAFGQVGQAGETALWVEGPYENEYVKDADGVWRFSKVHWYQTLAAPYDPGWHRAPLPLAGPLEDFPPDRPPTEVYASFPGSYLTPFHYDNPVSGRKLLEQH
jgi:SnoaL-like domain